MAQGITCAVVVGIFLVAVTFAVKNHLPALSLVGFVLVLGLLLALQLLHSFPRFAPRVAPYRRQTLLLQAVLTYLPFLVYGDAWLGMPGLLAGSALLILPTAMAWTVFGLVVGAAGPIEYLVGYHLDDLFYNVIAAALTACIVSGLSRMSDLVSELQFARTELARVAVMQERLRFSRDLHDLLGYSIATVTLKCEFAYRVATSEPDRAQDELREILQISRQALSDVQTLAGSYRSRSLRPEALAIQSMLHSVGIEAEIDIPEGLDLPGGVDATLVAVLREGVTNMLRHSRAGRCRIALILDPPLVSLTLWNNAGSAHRPNAAADHARGHVAGSDGTGGGNGIANLTHRLDELSGSLTSRAVADGYLLRAEVRLPTAEGDAHPAGAVPLGRLTPAR
ncbi:sensor histidine kinase [Kitasatospora sp. NPDC057015]|uniref:sensor histidine kinase n=1 Tax=Kitasatospora sp. NPDC057015 TaxID=3346001 RepID=UPI00362F8C81